MIQCTATSGRSKGKLIVVLTVAKLDMKSV